MAWYRLLAHVRPVPLYFRKIVKFTLLFHVEEYTDRIFESSMRTCTYIAEKKRTTTKQYSHIRINLAIVSDTNGETNKTST